MEALRIVVVEDEAPALAALRAALQRVEVPHKVVAEAASADEAVQVIDRERPDAVLLDIRLGDSTGFEVLERIRWKEARVIFTTAYDQYALRAFQCAAVHYLLKPVKTEELRSALQRIGPRSAAQLSISTLLQNRTRPEDERIVVPCAEGMHVLSPRSILRCEADGNYTRIFALQGERMISARTLKDFEAMLTAHRFERVHPSHLVNLLHVRKYINRDGGQLVLVDGSSVPLSQRRRQHVLEALAAR